MEYKTKLFENSVKFYSVKIWNSLPEHIKFFTQSNINVRGAINEWLLELRTNIFIH